MTAGIKKHKPNITKKKKNLENIVFLGKYKLNTMEVLISKDLIDSYISQEKFISVNNVLIKYNEMKNKIRNSEISVEYIV